MTLSYKIIRDAVGQKDSSGIKAAVVELINQYGSAALYMQLREDLQAILALGDSMNFTNKNKNDLIAEYIWLLIQAKTDGEEKQSYN